MGVNRMILFQQSSFVFIKFFLCNDSFFFKGEVFFYFRRSADLQVIAYVLAESFYHRSRYQVN